jgi:hypothetical protein
MYGDLGFTSLWNRVTGSQVPDSTRRTFLKNGKMFRSESREPQNQTISALITLRHALKGVLGVIVWENHFACPFPARYSVGLTMNDGEKMETS